MPGSPLAVQASRGAEDDLGEQDTAEPRLELVRELVERSRFTSGLRLRPEVAEPDRVELVMPFAESIATVDGVVHRGAITTLIDVAATAAAWSGSEVEHSARGVTTTLMVDFVRVARAEPLYAAGRVLRRGGRLCFCEVDVTNWDGALVAKGLATCAAGLSAP